MNIEYKEPKNKLRAINVVYTSNVVINYPRTMATTDNIQYFGTSIQAPLHKRT